MTGFALCVQCSSRRGIVAAISTFLADQGCNITDSAQFDDAEARIMAVVFPPSPGSYASERMG